MVESTMSSEKRTEACGRCTMSTIVDAIEAADGEGEGRDPRDRDPFGSERIEVDEETFSRVSPAVWLSRMGDRINTAARKFTYGR